jgi:dienelactone hydrolase
LVTRFTGMLALACGLLALLPAAAQAAFDPAYEAQNYSKINERQAEYSTPGYQTLLAQKGLEQEQEAASILATDPERNFTGNLCWQHGNGCAGDVRLYDWQQNGHGIVTPVLFTARNGATLSGHVWATRSGPSKRPGIVITNGSVQAPEQLYWFAATTLAKRGYVVLTFDPQGQGRSDTYGEGADQNEGVPSQAGRPFFDGTEDALDFFLSSTKKPYEPRKSCTSGTSHQAKQDRRVKAGLDAAYNPLWKLVDSSRIGLAGHSFGASGVSFVGQKDPRVKAIVAWDNLSAPSAGPAPCPADPESRTVPPITKPALGMSADYFLTPTPYTSEPDPQGKSAGANAYTKAGVDTGELIIRGGTHYEFSYIPNQAFGATLRGMDLVAWYTGAWFDKYVKGDATADRRLLTGRWRDDSSEAAVDPNHDGNQFSVYYRSRLDIGLSGGRRVDCEDLRAGCAELVADDGRPANYSYLAEALTPDGR